MPKLCFECEVEKSDGICFECKEEYCHSCFQEHVQTSATHSFLPLEGTNQSGKCGICNVAEVTVSCKECSRNMCIPCSSKQHSLPALLGHNVFPVGSKGTKTEGARLSIVVVPSAVASPVDAGFVPVSLSSAASISRRKKSIIGLSSPLMMPLPVLGNNSVQVNSNKNETSELIKVDTTTLEKKTVSIVSSEENVDFPVISVPKNISFDTSKVESANMENKSLLAGSSEDFSSKISSKPTVSIPRLPLPNLPIAVSGKNNLTSLNDFITKSPPASNENFNFEKREIKASEAEHQCSICELSTSTIFCSSCSAKFCDPCSIKQHSISKFSHHALTSIDGSITYSNENNSSQNNDNAIKDGNFLKSPRKSPRSNTFALANSTGPKGMCSICEITKSTLFCSSCQVSFCNECSNQQHAIAKFKGHALLPVTKSSHSKSFSNPANIISPINPANIISPINPANIFSPIATIKDKTLNKSEISMKQFMDYFTVKFELLSQTLIKNQSEISLKTINSVVVPPSNPAVSSHSIEKLEKLFIKLSESLISQSESLKNISKSIMTPTKNLETEKSLRESNVNTIDLSVLNSLREKINDLEQLSLKGKDNSAELELIYKKLEKQMEEKLVLITKENKKRIQQQESEYNESIEKIKNQFNAALELEKVRNEKLADELERNYRNKLKKTQIMLEQSLSKKVREELNAKVMSLESQYREVRLNQNLSEEIPSIDECTIANEESLILPTLEFEVHDANEIKERFHENIEHKSEKLELDERNYSSDSDFEVHSRFIPNAIAKSDSNDDSYLNNLQPFKTSVVDPDNRSNVDLQAVKEPFKAPKMNVTKTDAAQISKKRYKKKLNVQASIEEKVNQKIASMKLGKQKSSQSKNSVVGSAIIAIIGNIQGSTKSENADTKISNEESFVTEIPVSRINIAWANVPEVPPEKETVSDVWIKPWEKLSDNQNSRSTLAREYLKQAIEERKRGGLNVHESVGASLLQSIRKKLPSAGTSFTSESCYKDVDLDETKMMNRKPLQEMYSGKLLETLQSTFPIGLSLKKSVQSKPNFDDSLLFTDINNPSVISVSKTPNVPSLNFSKILPT